MKRLLLALALLSLAGCVWDPTNRTNQDNTAVITVTGYSPTPGATVTLRAKNHNNGSFVTIGTTHASSVASETGTYSLYYWAMNINPAANYWSPQSVLVNSSWKALNGLPGSAGRLEFTVTAGSYGPLPTFSADGKSCWTTHYNNGDSAWDSGAACYDGDSTAVFDNSGVGTPAPAPAVPADWHVIQYDETLVPGVRWEVGYYWVQGIYVLGYMCYPTGGGPHKAVIVNHSGFGGVEDTALYYCLAGAQDGWVTAMSAYRGESAKFGTTIYGPAPGSRIELCQGEVTDVLRLLDIVRSRDDVDDTQILMWGHSHGGCITERAVQRGAKVKAAASFSAPTDFYDWYQGCNSPSDCATHYPDNQGNIATTLGVPPQPPSAAIPVTPQMSRIPYDWRSPVTYKGDLIARKDVPFLMIHGGIDKLVYPSQACKLAAGTSSVNWHIAANGTITQDLPANGTGCDQLAWQPAANPVPTTSWPALRYLLIYDVAHHDNILVGAPFQAFTDWYHALFP